MNRYIGLKRKTNSKHRESSLSLMEKPKQVQPRQKELPESRMVTQTKESFDTDMCCGEEDSPALGRRCISAFTSEEVEKKF